MSALGLRMLLVHWECERRRFLGKAHAATQAGRPALRYLRTASRCEARLNKLARLVERASQPMDYRGHDPVIKGRLEAAHRQTQAGSAA